MSRPLRCPRDGTETAPEQATGRGRFQVDVCPACGGVWFDKGEIAKAARDREVERLIVAYAAGDAGVMCPRCGGGMVRRPVADAVLDVCPNCKGVWMDAGELETAVRSLSDEFSDTVAAAPIIGFARMGFLAGRLFHPSPSLRAILQPRIRRRHPRDQL